MAFFNNLATFRIVNNQIFIFVYKTFPLETNSPLSKDSNTEIKVIFPSERHNLARKFNTFDGKSSKRHQKSGQSGCKERVLLSRDQFDKIFFSAFFTKD